MRDVLAAKFLKWEEDISRHFKMIKHIFITSVRKSLMLCTTSIINRTRTNNYRPQLSTSDNETYLLRYSYES